MNSFVSVRILSIQVDWAITEHVIRLRARHVDPVEVASACHCVSARVGEHEPVAVSKLGKQDILVHTAGEEGGRGALSDGEAAAVVGYFSGLLPHQSRLSHVGPHTVLLKTSALSSSKCSSSGERST